MMTKQNQHRVAVISMLFLGLLVDIATDVCARAGGEEHRWTSGVFLFHLPLFKIQGLSLYMELTSWDGMAGQEYPGITHHLYPQVMGFWLDATSPTSYLKVKDSNSNLHTLAANTLPTEVF